MVTYILMLALGAVVVTSLILAGFFGGNKNRKRGKETWIPVLMGFGSIVLLCLLASLFWPANNGIHQISGSAVYLHPDGCWLNYGDGGDAILVRDLSDSKEFEKKISEVEVSRDLTQMRLELEACQRFDAMWRENPPSSERATHNHFVTPDGETVGVQDSVLCAEEDGFLCKEIRHACDGHYNFVTVR